MSAENLALRDARFHRAPQGEVFKLKYCPTVQFIAERMK